MFSKIDEETGKFLREDLRKEDATAIKLSLIDGNPSRLEQEKPSQFPFKNEKKKKGPYIEEVVSPTQMRRWGASLSGATPFFAPDRAMANAFTNEITIAQKKDHPSTPPVTPKPHERPWCIDRPSHERLYIVRFALVGDLLDAWSAFGGLSAQLSRLSIALHLAVTESATLAIMCDNEARALIQRLARVWGDDADFVKILTEENIDIKQRLKNEWGELRRSGY